MSKRNGGGGYRGESRATCGHVGGTRWLLLLWRRLLLLLALFPLTLSWNALVGNPASTGASKSSQLLLGDTARYLDTVLIVVVVAI